MTTKISHQTKKRDLCQDPDEMPRQVKRARLKENGGEWSQLTETELLSSN